MHEVNHVWPIIVRNDKSIFKLEQSINCVIWKSDTRNYRFRADWKCELIVHKLLPSDGYAQLYFSVGLYIPATVNATGCHARRICYWVGIWFTFDLEMSEVRWSFISLIGIIEQEPEGDRHVAGDITLEYNVAGRLCSGGGLGAHVSQVYEVLFSYAWVEIC